MTLLIISLIKVLFFYDPHCPDCIAVEKNILPEVKKIPYVELKMLSIEEQKNMELLMDIEDAHKDYNNGIPVVVVGDSIFGNRKEIEEGLLPYLKTLNPEAKENVELPEKRDTLKIENPVYILYFYSSGCLKCSKADIYLKSLEKAYPNLHVKRMDVSKDGGLLLSIEKSIGIEKEKYLVTPVVIIDTLIFFQKDLNRLKDTIEKVSSSGGNLPFWENYERKVISPLVESMKMTGIFLAGVIDGINPCAFAALIFLVAFLSMRGGRREILWAGIPFIISVYITYLFIGLGIFSVFRQMEGIKLASRILYTLSGLLAIFLGILSFRDAFLYRKGRDMVLQMPDRFKKIVRGSIRKGFGTGLILLSGLLIGFLVTLFEFTCTGQVYYPVITYIARDPLMRIKAMKMLIVYNLGFILPVAIVFVLSIFGFGQREFNRFLIRRVVAVKILTGILLLVIGIWVMKMVL